VADDQASLAYSHWENLDDHKSLAVVAKDRLDLPGFCVQLNRSGLVPRLCVFNVPIDRPEAWDVRHAAIVAIACQLLSRQAIVRKAPYNRRCPSHQQIFARQRIG